LLGIPYGEPPGLTLLKLQTAEEIIFNDNIQVHELGSYRFRANWPLSKEGYDEIATSS
jgi:hypothetical protein